VWALLKKSAGKGIHKAWAYIFGFLSGYAGGALSILGPPVLVYVSLESWSKDETKAILQGFLLLAGLVVVLFHAALGITTKRVLLLYTGSIPLIFLGAYFGSKLYGRLNELVYRKVVIFLIGLMGIILIIKSHLP
jgi:uncharacterized membrane protein YfcA